MPALPLAQALTLAREHFNAGRWADAESICDQIVALEHQNADALHLLGLIAASTERCEAGLVLLQRAAALAPNRGDFHANLGVLLRRMERFEEAVAGLRRAADLQPESAEIHMNLGDACYGAARFEEAIVHTQRALALRPDYPAALSNLGNALERTDRPEEALSCLRRAIGLDPAFARAHNNLAHVLLGQRRFDEALAGCERALALDPDLTEAYGNLWAAWVGKGEPETAIRILREIIGRRPDLAGAHWSLALLLLLTQRYEEGWAEYEWRWRSPGLGFRRRHFSVPAWEGHPLPGGTLLLHCEQGLGDAIQFARYVPLARERSGAARVLLECHPALTRLFTESQLGAEVLSFSGLPAEPSPGIDRCLPLLSLPLVLRNFAPLPMTTPYLRAGIAAREAWRSRLETSLPPPPSSANATPVRHVGLAWAGNPAHALDRQRSIPFGKLAPLLSISGVQFHSLQFPSSSLSDSSSSSSLSELLSPASDFSDTAAVLNELDLIITVDTATAHLAGALGRPVWTLLSSMPDWRWGLESEQTPWYPTMRLFRQKLSGDWDEVIARVATALRETSPSP